MEIPLVFCLAFAAFLFMVFGTRLAHGIKKSVFWSFIGIFVLLSGIRWKTGTDWDSYYQHFEQLASGERVMWFEPGYEAVTRAFLLAGSSYTFFLLSFGFLTISLKAYVFSRTRNPLAALFAYICLAFGDVFFVRQSLAISIILISYYLYFHRPRLSTIVALIAPLMHLASLAFCVPLVAACMRRRLVLAFFLLVVTALLAKFLLDDERVAEKFYVYFSEGSAFVPEDPGWGRWIGKLTLALLYGIGFFALKKEHPVELTRFISISFFIAALTNLVAEPLIQVSTIFTRVFQFSIPFEIVAFATLVPGFRGEATTTRMLISFGVAAIYVIRMTSAYDVYPDLYTPFEFFWGDAFKETY